MVRVTISLIGDDVSGKVYVLDGVERFTGIEEQEGPNHMLSSNNVVYLMTNDIFLNDSSFLTTMCIFS